VQQRRVIHNGLKSSVRICGVDEQLDIFTYTKLCKPGLSRGEHWLVHSTIRVRRAISEAALAINPLMER